MKDGLDTVLLSKRFKNSKIYCYEANPLNNKQIKKIYVFAEMYFLKTMVLVKLREEKLFCIHSK